jgi:predicted DsbA family dithiol-disulfide isomerase
VAAEPEKNMTSRNVEIDVVSDVVCPWCFIGKRRLDAALAGLRAEDPKWQFVVRWQPYFLNPDTPPEGEPYRPYLERKFGGPAGLAAIWERVRAAGHDADVEFAFERIAMRPNTLNAHRLLYRAQTAGRDATGLVERFFVAHFQQGEDLGDLQKLAALAAAENGEDAATLLAYLRSDADAEAVKTAAGQAQASGVSGVPFFIFNQRLAVSGAQPVAVLRDAIGQAAG